MSELQTRIENANPRPDCGGDDLIPPFDAIWLQAQRAPTPVRRKPPVRFARTVVRTPRGWVAIAGTAASAAVAAVVLSAGTAPSVAQAFPILGTTSVDLRTHVIIAPRGIVASALGSAHPFSEPYGTGYVVESPDGNTICLLIPSPSSTPAGPSTSLVACGSTQSLEQQGTAFVVNGPAGSPDAFVALVPAGGGLTVTADGATTAVPADDGIATGVISQAEGLTLQVGGSTTSEQVTPNSPASTQLTPTSPRSAALTYANTLNGSTSATGSTAPTN